MSNGKGDSPRNCFSKKFKDNYDAINWGRADLKRKCLYCEGSGSTPPKSWIYAHTKCKYCKGTGQEL